MKKAVSIILGIIFIMAVFAGCDAKETAEITAETTVETTTKTADEVQKEIDAYRASKEKLDQEVYKLLEQVGTEENIDEDLLKDIESKQVEIDKVKALARKTLSPEAYEELYYEIEFYSEPVTYANQRFYLESGYYVYAKWSQNVVIDENNENEDFDRVYYLKDDSKPGYLLVEGVETPQELVVILPGTQN